MNAIRKDILSLNWNVNKFIDLFGNEFEFLYQLKNTEQDIVWHAEGDVHIHTDMVLKEVYELIVLNNFTESEQFVLILSALLHDIAKPISTKKVFSDRDNRELVIAPNHEQKGMDYIFHKLLNYVDHKNRDFHDFMSYEEFINIVTVVGYHQIPKKVVGTDFNRYTFANIAMKVNPKLVYFLEVADFKGRTCYDTESQLDYLHLFKSYMDDFGYLDGFDKASLGIENEYVLHKGFNLLKTGEISMFDEAEAKFFEHKNNHAELILLSGLSGVGKTTYIKENYSNHTIISFDDIRESLSFRENQKDNAEVVRIAKDRLKIHLARKEKIVFDATNIRIDLRDKILTIGHNYHALNKIVFLVDSLNNIIERDKKREYSVGEKVILTQEYNFQTPDKSEADDVSWVLNRTKF